MQTGQFEVKAVTTGYFRLNSDGSKFLK